jgi:hypothetical protein
VQNLRASYNLCGCVKNDLVADGNLNLFKINEVYVRGVNLAFL